MGRGRGFWFGRRGVVVATGLAIAAGSAVVGVVPATTLAASATGSTWTAAQAPLPSNAAKGTKRTAALNSIACPTISSCVAVGFYLDSAGNEQGLVLTRVSGKWSASEAPLPPGATGGDLTAVACTSVNNCVAVGSAFGSSSSALLLTQTAGAWAAHTISGSADGLNAVACSAAAGCTATDSNGDVVDLVAGQWTATSIASPWGGTSWSSQSIACQSQCVVVGYADLGSSSTGAVIAQGTGTKWTAEQAPRLGSSSLLNAVACAKAACTAVGAYTDTSGDSQAMLLTTYPGGWKAKESPLPADAATNPDAELYAVACPIASSCEAVGGYFTSSSLQGLIDSGANTSWTATEAPLADGSLAYYGLDVVGCASASLCVTSSAYANAPGWLLSGAGTSWTAVQAPLPTSAYGGVVAAPVSAACAAKSICYLVGSYQDKYGFSLGLLEMFKAG